MSERGPRGIRAGKSAKRKRDTYIRYRIQQGDNPERIPVAHQGGQQRLLFTPNTWSPESSEQEEETAEFCEPDGIEANLEDVVDLTAPTDLLPLSRDRLPVVVGSFYPL